MIKPRFVFNYFITIRGQIKDGKEGEQLSFL